MLGSITLDGYFLPLDQTGDACSHVISVVGLIGARDYADRFVRHKKEKA